MRRRAHAHVCAKYVRKWALGSERRKEEELERRRQKRNYFTDSRASKRRTSGSLHAQVCVSALVIDNARVSSFSIFRRVQGFKPAVSFLCSADVKFLRKYPVDATAMAVAVMTVPKAQWTCVIANCRYSSVFSHKLA